MTKHKLTLSKDSEIIKQAKLRDINISDEVEKCIMKKLNLRKVTIESIIEYAEECEKPCKDITKYKLIGK